METNSIKQMQLETWTKAAQGWKRNDALLRGFTAKVSARMIESLRPGQRVLDIASGTGEPAIEAADRVGPTGSVLGFDFVEPMLAFAREKATKRGLKNIEFRVSDGEIIDVPPETFDAATMRWGLMFMPDPQACLSRVHRALKPGGTIALTCWAAPDENVWASLPVSVLKRHVDIPDPPPGAPGLFAFADKDRLSSTVQAGGFHEVKVEKVTFTMVDFPSGRAFIDYQLDLAGPIAMIFNRLPAEKQEHVRSEIAREAEMAGGVPVRLEGNTWLATGKA